jgi:hypothetical protein
MGLRTASLVLLSAFAVALGACSHDTGPAVDPNLFPTDYKREIVVTLQKLFTKNETVRVSDALIADPSLAVVDKEQRYMTCVRYTAHGVNPGDIGSAVRLAYFYGGHLNQLIPATGDQCSRAVYKPFLELDKLCLGQGCK